MPSYPLIIGDLPEGTCFTTPARLAAELAKVSSIEIPSTSAAGIVTGSSTPTAEQRGLPWLRTDGSGKPIGLYWWFSGAWRRFYSEAIGSIKFIDIPLTDFDTSGKGVVGSMWDGWAVCNGANGTPDLRDRFIVGGKEYSSSKWQSNITGALTATGGEANHELTPDDLPPWLDTVNGDTGAAGVPYLEITGAGRIQVLNSTTSSSLRAQTAIPLPPYKVLGMVRFNGYS